MTSKMIAGTLSGLLLLFGAGLTGTAHGATDNWGPLVVLHATSHPLKGDPPCISANNPITQDIWCWDYMTGWPLNTPSDVYMVVVKGDPELGIAWVSCGISYNGTERGGTTKTDQSGVDVYSWQECSSGPSVYTPPTSDPDAFPASGGGIKITWDAATDCQRTVVYDDGAYAVAGVFYVYAYGADYFQVVYNAPASPQSPMQVGDCTGGTHKVEYPGGAIAFGPLSTWGTNPCIPDPVAPVSWSRLKTTYKRSEDRP